jgi:hypothetical protein
MGRGASDGALKKKFGLKVASERVEAHPIAPESQAFELPVRLALYGRTTRWRVYYAVIDGVVQVLHVRHGRRGGWQP